ncbi:HNHc domain containing protein [uncultured Caudovirales phage]|uniref:HNHc domain containing protein n=1 Tax=uncultured Caudovirales phage TaxID=2100421 RepID=A0A6J5MGS0_9CAUD|nr:HNHc domain containing protein [uncultured Caudovirales phage]
MAKQNLSAETLRKRAAYEASEEQKTNRAERNAARAAMMKKGVVRKGDGKDVGHVTPLDRGGSNDPKNWQVQSIPLNRGWKRGGKTQP